ncbi:MAG: hypothetical protein KJT01_05470 [Gemmatimonadetes bacterium]|nr:hypothetical protein [Gemmatimonadota bacterium]
MGVLPSLLWIDCTGALVAGVLVLISVPFLSVPYALPRPFPVATGVANLANGTFSHAPARRARRPAAPVRDAVYAAIARRRLTLVAPRCLLPSGEERARLLA